MLLSLLFVSGYLLGMAGFARIIYSPVKTLLGVDPRGSHAVPNEDGVFAALTVTVGAAAMWPIVAPMYYLTRRPRPQVS